MTVTQRKGKANPGDGHHDPVLQEVVDDLRGRILLRHELTFVLSVVNVFATAFILGHSPASFPVWHSIKGVVLLVIRFFDFRSKGYQYLLVDLCYIVSLLILVYLYLAPWSTTLFRVVFALSTGPLAWSVMMFRNSLVLHSISHMTSLWLHLSPALLMWSMRWYGVNNEPYAMCETPDCSVSAFIDSRGVAAVVLPVVATYAAWLFIHYAIVFWIKADEIKKRGLYTLYQSNSLKPIVALGGDVEWRRRTIYFSAHAVFALGGCFVSTIMWSSFWIHTLYLCVVMAWSAWNGSTFYFHVFSARYEDDLAKRAAKHARLSMGAEPAPTTSTSTWQ